MMRGQKPFRAFRIRNIGGMHQNAQEETIISDSYVFSIG